VVPWWSYEAVSSSCAGSCPWLFISTRRRSFTEPEHGVEFTCAITSDARGNVNRDDHIHSDEFARFIATAFKLNICCGGSRGRGLAHCFPNPRGYKCSCSRQRQIGGCCRNSSSTGNRDTRCIARLTRRCLSAFFWYLVTENKAAQCATVGRNESQAWKEQNCIHSEFIVAGEANSYLQHFPSQADGSPIYLRY
jgi:hypothetical protein